MFSALRVLLKGGRNKRPVATAAEKLAEKPEVKNIIKEKSKAANEVKEAAPYALVVLL